MVLKTTLRSEHDRNFEWVRAPPKGTQYLRHFRSLTKSAFLYIFVHRAPRQTRGCQAVDADFSRVVIVTLSFILKIDDGLRLLELIAAFVVSEEISIVMF